MEGFVLNDYTKLSVPAFYTKDPEQWFTQIESTIHLRKITTQMD